MRFLIENLSNIMSVVLQYFKNVFFKISERVSKCFPVLLNMSPKPQRSTSRIMCSVLLVTHFLVVRIYREEQPNIPIFDIAFRMERTRWKSGGKLQWRCNLGSFHEYRHSLLRRQRGNMLLRIFSKTSLLLQCGVHRALITEFILAILFLTENPFCFRWTTSMHVVVFCKTEMGFRGLSKLQKT